MNNVVTTQAYNIQAVVWRKYNKLLTTMRLEALRLSWNAGAVPYGQAVRYEDYNLDCYQL